MCFAQSASIQNAANMQQNAAFYGKLAIFEMCMVSRWIPYPKNCVQHPKKPLNTYFEPIPSMQSALLQNAAKIAKKCGKNAVSAATVVAVVISNL